MRTREDAIKALTEHGMSGSRGLPEDLARANATIFVDRLIAVGVLEVAPEPRAGAAAQLLLPVALIAAFTAKSGNVLRVPERHHRGATRHWLGCHAQARGKR